VKRLIAVALLLGACSSEEPRVFGLRERVQKMCDRVETELTHHANEARDHVRYGRRPAIGAEFRNVVVMQISERLDHCIEMRGDSPLPATLARRVHALDIYLIMSEDPVVISTVLNELEAIAVTTNSLELID
jgi:hypothetical protein